MGVALTLRSAASKILVALEVPAHRPQGRLYTCWPNATRPYILRTPSSGWAAEEAEASASGSAHPPGFA